MLRREVLGTISVGRRVLLIAEVPGGMSCRALRVGRSCSSLAGADQPPPGRSGLRPRPRAFQRNPREELACASIRGPDK